MNKEQLEQITDKELANQLELDIDSVEYRLERISKFLHAYPDDRMLSDLAAIARG